MEETRFEIGHKDGRVVMNITGGIGPCHLTWTIEQAREVARLIFASVDMVDPPDRVRYAQSGICGGPRTPYGTKATMRCAPCHAGRVREASRLP